MEKPVEVTIQLYPEHIQMVEQFREDSIRMNSVHGTRETTEWYRQMGITQLAQQYFHALIGKEDYQRRKKKIWK